MKPYEEPERQIRIEAAATRVIMPSIVIGYMLTEGMPLLDAVLVVTKNGRFASGLRRSGISDFEGVPTDDESLRRAGAGRVISPFRIAARFMLLATTRPVVSDFITYVLYNPLTHLETSELCIDETSPWVRRQIGDLDLQTKYEGRVIGARLTDEMVVYAPPPQFRVEAGHVMLIVTTMERFDSLREDACGSANKRPKSFRTAKPASATYRAGERYSLS
ncbi:MAG: hypothetical protein IPM16_05175 [Chloroflexi bacterium]|nr:hypothetical protein [Chloroflexota bacterium]